MPNKSARSQEFKYIKSINYILIAVVTLLFFLISLHKAIYPYGVNYGEAPIINQANRMLVGKVIYKNDFNSPPYIVTNYPPIYIKLLSILQSNLGIRYYLAGRLISLISAGISAGIVTSIAYRLTQKYYCGLIALGLFLGHPYLITWSSVVRVDLLGLSFSLLGIYIILFYWESIFGILIGVALFTASIYTRQSFLLAAPLGASVWLYKNDKKKFYIFILCLLFVNIIVFIYLNITTRNGFYMNVVTANINDFSVTRLLSMLKNFFIIWPIVILVALFRLISKAKEYLNHNQHPIQDLQVLNFLIPYILGTVITTLTAGKVGSDINYFLELIVALVMVLSLTFIRDKDKSFYKNFLYNISIPTQFLWIIVIIFAVNVRNLMVLRTEIGWRENLFEEIESATIEGFVLTDDYLDLVVLAGQQIYYQPFEYGQLFKADKWDPKNFTKELEEKKFPLIVIGGNEFNKDCCWPKPIRDSISSNYEVKSTNRLLYITPAIE